MRQRHLDNSKGIFSMWWNWTVSTGLLIFTTVLSLWVPPVWLPLATFGLDLILFVMIKNNRQTRVPGCYLIPFICSRALMWSAVIMVIINLLYSHWFIYRVFDLGTINRQIPFITQLIVSPATFVVALWADRKHSKLSFCRDCRIRYGTPAERGFLGKMFTQEGRYQNRMLIIFSGFCSVTAWGYYFATYVNESLNNMDKFFFVWISALVFFITTIYMVFRYLGLWSYYCKREENLKMHGATMTKLRFIIFHDNTICLHTPTFDSDNMIEGDGKIDTPIQLNLSYRTKVTLFDAIKAFDNISGLKNVDVRFMYSNLNTNADYNIFHYLCFLTDEQRNEFDEKHSDVEWLGLTSIARLINEQDMAPLFSAEFIRLHTIAMAWKTYDEEGRRKYKIKNYRPTFRLCDVKKYDVDYNDPTWLYVADNNEDSPFYKIKHLWRKYINGIG